MYSPPPTLSNPNGPGGLLCITTVGPIAWWSGDSIKHIDYNVPGKLIYQIIPMESTTAQIVNDGRSANDVDVSGFSYHNGLFACRRNGEISTAIPVGFYQRGGAMGELICLYTSTDKISLQHLNLMFHDLQYSLHQQVIQNLPIETLSLPSQAHKIALITSEGLYYIKRPCRFSLYFIADQKLCYLQ